MGIRWIRCRLDAAIAAGVALSGCSDRSLGDSPGDDAGSADGSTSGAGGSASAGSNATSPGTSASSATTVATSAEADGDDGVRFDLGIRFDVGVRYDVGGVPDLASLDCGAEPMLPIDVCDYIEHGDGWIGVACMDASDLPRCPDPASFASYELVQACVSCTYVVSEICGPAVNDDGACCYWAYAEGQSCPGRPFVVDGRARLAAVVARHDWCADAPACADFDPALAQAWLHDARTEHAAIASFSRFALQLLALAAPPAFVAAAQRAALDELEHARLCFALAARHGARGCGPGPLAIDGAFADADDPIAMVVATVREGCVAETVSALQLARACAAAADPWVRTQLERMLAQEIEHVELAWSFVAWAYARGDADLRAAIRTAFADAWRWIPRGAAIEPDPRERERWRAAGRLPLADRVAIANQALDELVRPLAAVISTDFAGGRAGESSHAIAPRVDGTARHA